MRPRHLGRRPEDCWSASSISCASLNQWWAHNEMPDWYEQGFPHCRTPWSISDLSPARASSLSPRGIPILQCLQNIVGSHEITTVAGNPIQLQQAFIAQPGIKIHFPFPSATTILASTSSSIRPRLGLRFAWRISPTKPRSISRSWMGRDARDTPTAWSVAPEKSPAKRAQSRVICVISKEKEILIDLIDRIIPIKLVKFLKFLTNILTFLIFCFLLYSMINPAISSWKYGDISLELGVPIWFLWLISVIGVSGIILISLHLFVYQIFTSHHASSLS